LDYDYKAGILVSGNAEDYIAAFHVNNVSGELTLLKNRQLPSKGISSLKIRPDGKILVAGSWDSTTRLYSRLKPQNLKPLGALKFHENAIDAIDVTCKLIAAGSSDGNITIWNVKHKVCDGNL
jgi:WD40 repeat protein